VVRVFGSGCGATGFIGCAGAHMRRIETGSGCGGCSRCSLCRRHASYTQFCRAQRTRDLTNGMREIRTSGSVGAPGRQRPGATRSDEDLAALGLRS
jgi:hypothetical protein